MFNNEESFYIEKKEVNMSGKQYRKKLIACKIFKNELTAVLPEKYKDIDIIWLDPGLHYDLGKIEVAIKNELKQAKTEGADARVLFGNACHPDMCSIVEENDGKILGSKNCLHAFCGEKLRELEQDRTTVVTPGWIRYFSDMMEAAGWDEVDIRMNLGRYDRILLMDTGVNPISDEELLEYFEVIQIPVEIEQTDLEHFKEKLAEVLE